MNDPTPPASPLDGPDEELVRRALDGEASSAERDSIDADPRLAAALAHQRQVVLALAEPVAVLPPSEIDAMVARALDAAAGADADAGAAVPPPGAAPSTSTTRLDHGRDRSRRPAWGGWAAAAAVLVLLGVGAVVVRAASSGSDAADTASMASAPTTTSPATPERSPLAGGENSTASESATDQAAAGAAAFDPDILALGPLDDALTADELIDRALTTTTVQRQSQAPPVQDSAVTEELVELVTCVSELAPTQVLSAFGHGTVAGRPVDVVVVIDERTGVGRALVIGPDCTLEAERAL